MATVRDFVNLALGIGGVVGVGQTALAEDSQKALSLLDLMLKNWSAQKLMIYHLVTVSKVGTGALSYTIGTGGDFNTPRPSRIDSAFVRMNTGSPSPVDYPLFQIMSRSDYNTIALKNLATIPSTFYYDAAYPLGNIFFWPVPINLYEVSVSVPQPLPGVSQLSDNLDMPDFYGEAVLYNLVRRVRAAYRRPADPEVNSLAGAGLRTIKQNSVDIATLNMPPALWQGSSYNVYSDQGN